jgi:hypothetical protein
MPTPVFHSCQGSVPQVNTNNNDNGNMNTVDCNPNRFPFLEQMEQEFLYSNNSNNMMEDHGEHNQQDNEEPILGTFQFIYTGR